jgi:aminoglycoside 6'-N-acetyltransferase
MSSSIDFRRLDRTDFPLLASWLAQPHVARWWNHDTSDAAIEADFGPSIDGADPADMFVVSMQGQPIGFLQRYRFGDNPEYISELDHLMHTPPEALSIDYFVGEPSVLRRGMGTAMIGSAVAALWSDYPAAPAVIVPVSAANTASWRTLERAGFTRIAEGELAPDNPIDGRAHYVYRIERPFAAGQR